MRVRESSANGGGGDDMEVCQDQKLQHEMAYLSQRIKSD